MATGEVGEIYFADSRPFEYFDEPEKTREAFNDQGWATTGDMGYLDEEGFLYLTDRKNFTIITGGVNVYPAEIEGLLVAHDKVADAAVFGVPHPEYGEAVTAVIQPVNWADATEQTAAELTEWMRDRLSSIKVPKTIDMITRRSAIGWIVFANFAKRKTGRVCCIPSTREYTATWAAWAKVFCTDRQKRAQKL